MQNFSYIAALLLLAPGVALAIDQTEAQEQARRLHDDGSDDSLKSSYGNGLRAVNQFFQLNIPGAITYGVKAYGQYRNSEKLDDMKDKDKNNRTSMNSVGVSGPSASGITGKSEYVSPYARLDTKFLREGETAEIAEKLERLSGISRDKMFQLAVKTHTNSKAIDDPNYLTWFRKTYRDLASEITNKDFRDSINSFGDKLEVLYKTGAAQGVLAQFKSQDAGREPATMVAKASQKAAEPVAELKEQHAEAAPLIPEPAIIVHAPSAPAKADSNGLNETAGFTSRGTVSAVTSMQRPGFDRIQFDAKDPFFNKLIQSADAPNAGPSIFQVVSLKIKEMSIRQGLGEKSSVASLSQ